MCTMKNSCFAFAIGLAALSIGSARATGQSIQQVEADAVVKLPQPKRDGKIPLEEALQSRRSVRSYSARPLTLAEVGQLLWAAQGVTSRDGKRTAPSAGALYPLEVHLVAGNVEDLPPGVYRYRPREHDLVQTAEGDKRGDLAAAALDQSCVKSAASAIVFAAVYERTARKYGDRAVRYAHIEVGHAAQNVCLQAAALQLGTVPVGAFDDERVGTVLMLKADERPLYIMTLGGIK